MEEEGNKVNESETWKVNVKERVSACDNRPGLKKIYVKVLGSDGEALRGVKIRFDTEHSEGQAYDHRNIYGLTDADGYLEWEHLGVPTRYVMYMGNADKALLENIRTDLGSEYCRPRGSAAWSGWRPVNRPGIYSYRIEVQEK